MGMSLVSVQPADAQSTCREIDALPNPVVRAGVPGEAVSDGDVGCYVIHDGNGFVAPAAAIGDISVIRRGVLAAVSISGVNQQGGGVVNFGREIQVCLRGTGSFIYRSAATTPRVSAQLPAVTRELNGGNLYTCALVSTEGIAVLIPGEPAVPAAEATPVAGTEEAAPTGTEEAAAPAGTEEAAAPQPAAQPATTGDTVELSGCRVTTTAMVRMRSEPNTDSMIMTRLPYRLSLQAIARTADSDWYNVIYGDDNGWVSGRYLQESAGCAE